MSKKIAIIEQTTDYLESRMQLIEEILADVNAIDDEGRTALHRAAASGDEGLIILLAKNNANWNCVTRDEEETPLHLSIKNGHHRATELILRHNKIHPKTILLDAKTKKMGSTALHIGVEMGRLDLVHCLLKFQAKHFIRDNSEKTPVDLATDLKIIELFNHVFECFDLYKKYDPKLLPKLQALKHDDLLAVGNAGHDIEHRSIYNRLTISWSYWEFLGESWDILYEATQKEQNNFEKTYVSRTHRCKS